ncbi:hypothetical protein NBO_16g0051 [Nosema bombycis CQ1]|uniref:Uncharacterized protein n=1 Tax=Nosema bombycis (strain CQ1 / CVCC 102059) TaxID=578461 RepID=R0KV64_NOSB1|nr:hypothetical protein NBO_16g0051 [Nosema bombycis CQ1]|eukprot:EOB14766.1 hypothetical protein NBO_16g0051 [Nosema bombycis CQ1]
MLLRKTIAGAYLFLMNICATNPLGDLQFIKKDGSCYLVLPFNIKEDDISGCELAIKKTVGDFNFNFLHPIDYDIDHNRIIFNLDKVRKSKLSEYMIHVHASDKKVFKSATFVWKRRKGNFAPI